MNLSKFGPMKSLLLVLLLVCCGWMLHAQIIYNRAFGKVGDPAIVFLHGGPGYNCANFEGTTAQALADRGFYVVVYDRLGEGRSLHKTAEFTFASTNKDLLWIYKKHKLKQASLIGHSFGGMVAVNFAQAYPAKVKSLFLVGAPMNLQASFKTILRSSKAIYEAKGDTLNAGFIAKIETWDTTSLEYSTYCFGHAMQNGFYSPKQRTPEAEAILDQFAKDTLHLAAALMSARAPKAFWKNDHYTTLDLTSVIRALAAKGNVYGLYGKEDGLYSPAQVQELAGIIGQERLLYLDQCGHNVFIDQQQAFLEALVKWGR
jgi:proline iminopeptidase